MGQQSLSATSTKLNRIAWLSKQDSGKRFECLMHLFNQESLIECFHELDENKAVGIDGVTKRDYGENLYSNIDRLISKMKDMAYRPGPVREVFIPKEGNPGAIRALGISNLEDKIIQKMMQKVLESIYEPLFLECSHGFRPGKSCHTAIQALQNHLYKQEIQTVIDIDLKNFFGSIDHQLLENILKDKIKDPKFMRYINRMFKSGILTEGELKMSEEGVPQGSICSPVLSNIFAHFVIDAWIEEMVKPACAGTVELFRYADDAVICCQHEADAVRIRQSLGKRLEKYKLQLNEEKTKIVPFDRRAAARGVKQGTFDFLGFTFYLGIAQSGRVIPKLKTRAKTIRMKLKRVNEWAKQVRNKKPLREIWRIFKAKLRGHIQYYGVSHNIERVNGFLFMATGIVYKWLNRRSQCRSFNWDQFKLYQMADPLPSGRIIHKLF
jgi:RNA-directed DNA polymerase